MIRTDATKNNLGLKLNSELVMTIGISFFNIPKQASASGATIGMLLVLEVDDAVDLFRNERDFFATTVGRTPEE